MPTIKDIAKKLGVSVSTVSRALNNHPDIREETKEEVLEAIKKLNYTPNALARSLIHKRSYTIGLMIPDITDQFFSAMAQGVEEVLSDSGYLVVYGNMSRSPKKERIFLQNASERKMDGLIVTPDTMDDEMIALLQRLEIPVVFLRRRPPASLQMPFVDVDHYKGTCKAIEYLLSLGHKDIGFIGLPDYSFTGRERYRGFVDTMNRHGIELHPNGCVFDERSIALGYQGMAQLHVNYPGMTAVFAANDLLGVGALEWLAENRISVPEQMSVVGFDNLEMTNLHWIKLTTVAQPRTEMGKKAAELLMEMISEKRLASESILFDTELVIRNTCASPNVLKTTI
ncbi:LacI family DNA-binding transcriptional regulator [Paenibacillus thalictri]|uniref:LacI family transcriptional regulator n=1 Tax=Paenibacillus thalictri TaxID=2527873 RepID=A0A4Q9DKY3_9BACL|nr:LacI family DNA-binding transcriptional regulator [Paenibacillus thalictri]TBL75649.1 LacI family transcriptional regulator [Paenibacillus thalictri]